MPTTTQKEHTHEARSLDPRTGRRLTKRLAAVLNPAQPFLVALRQRDLRRLFAGLVVSQAGDWLYNLALLAFVYERTGSTVWVGITTAARILPEVVLGPIGGVLADRHDRRLVMIASDVLRAAAMAALAVVALAGGPVVLAPVLAALCTAAGAAYPQCVVAVLPRLVDEADLPAANAARVGITGLCVVAGPLIGAVLLLLGSAAIVFAVNGVSFLFGALVVAALPRDAMRRPAVSESHASLPADLATGWRALREHPDVLPLVAADVVSSAVYGALTVLFVLLGEKLGLGAAGYGYLLSALGVGGVLSAGLADRAASSDRPRRALILAVAAVGLPLLLLALTGSTVAALVLAGSIGGGVLTTEVVADTTLQRSLDPAVSPAPTGSSSPRASPGSPPARCSRRRWSRCSGSTPRCSSPARSCSPTAHSPSCGRRSPRPSSSSRASLRELLDSPMRRTMRRTRQPGRDLHFARRLRRYSSICSRSVSHRERAWVVTSAH